MGSQAKQSERLVLVAARRSDREGDAAWLAPPGLVNAAVRLRQRGLLERVKGNRGSKLFRITDAGRAALSR